jgi:hypothetical protein
MAPGELPVLMRHMERFQVAVRRPVLVYQKIILPTIQ